MATTFANVHLTQQEPFSLPHAKVLVTFDVQGILPDVVQILAQEAGSQPANPVYAEFKEEVDIASPNPEGGAIIELQAGNAFDIWLCPRDKTGDVPDEEYDGEYWQDACVYGGKITTQVPQAPSGNISKPVITAIERHPATLNGDNSITISWVSSPYDKFLIWWAMPGLSLQQGEVDESGHSATSGRWTTNQPLKPRTDYTFKVEGGTSAGASGRYNYSDWGPAVTVSAVDNLRSLAELLRLSGITPAGQRIKALMGGQTSLKKVMKLQ
jgi:hypothetical protein